jgi:peptide chain release factor subunit 1
MAATMTWEGLRELAGFRTHNGCALSLYLDLDPSTTPTASDVEARARSILDRARETGDDGLTHDQRVALREDVERIRRYVDDEFDRDGSRGLVIFCSRLDNLWRPLPLAEPVRDELKLGRELYLAPLVRMVERADGSLVAVVSRERGDVYRLGAGRLELLDERFDEQPGRHDQGGWSQANYQRHIENLVHEHLKAFAERLDRRVRRLRPSSVVMICLEELRTAATDLLARETLETIVGWTQAEAHAGPSELLQAARPLLDEARLRKQREVVSRWEEEAGRAGRASAGWEATIEAASDGRIEVLLCLEGVAAEAWQCPRCGRGSVKAGTCPLDGTTLEEHPDALDLAVHQTLHHGGRVTVLSGAGELGPVGGVGALLRF